MIYPKTFFKLVYLVLYRFVVFSISGIDLDGDGPAFRVSHKPVDNLALSLLFIAVMPKGFQAFKWEPS